MFIYLVTDVTEYEGDAHLGVFSTFAKAKKFLVEEKCIGKGAKPSRKGSTFWFWGSGDGFCIEKHKVE